ncbi:CHAT domain-containing protein [uncultured Aquimarina sp.]|uniref:CHAT domain-containing protein n=1 Tax=uncultured Aquimarina sp. TaxID=575652 RepID=UPI0026368979|nr:CHAT domain-containing protein [uncultured Aquimarina sp.]
MAIHQVNAQQISKKLDSIHQLKISNDEKIVLYDQLLDDYRKEKNYTQLGSDAHQLAKWLHKKKDKKREAIAMVQKAVDARTKAVPFNAELLRRSYYNLANYNKREKNYYTAIPLFKKMLEIQGSNFLNDRAYMRIGESYESIGDPYKAVEYHLKAFSHIENKVRYEIMNHINIANAYKSIRNKKAYKNAIEHLITADSLAHSLEIIDTDDLYHIYNNLGGTYFEGLKDTIQGEFYLKKALKVAHEINISEYITITSYNLGLLTIKKNNELAKKYFNLSFNYSKSNAYMFKSIYVGLGIIGNSEKNYAQATLFYHKSLSAFFNTNITPENILKILDKKTLRNANEKMLLLEIFKKIIDNYIDQSIKENNENLHKTAIEIVKLADQLIDLIMDENISYNSKLLWRDLASEIYISGMSICNLSNNIEYGFYLSEKNKVLLLLQEIIKNNIPKEILERELNLEQNIRRLQEIHKNRTWVNDSIVSAITRAKNELTTFKDSLSINYPAYASNKKPSIITLSDVNLNDNEIIIQYLIAEQVAGLTPNTYGLIISNRGKKVFKIPNTNKLFNNIVILREYLDAPFKTINDIESYKKVANQLYTSLIPINIRKELYNKKVTIIADHKLSLIPFEALVTNLNSEKYFIEDCEINYVYSLSFQKENASIARNTAKDFLGVAPINYTWGLTTLNNSEDELKAANTYYDGSILIGEKATIDNFKKEIQNYKIIHLATHADASDSITPWIAFRNSKLTNEQLYTLKNSAELVLLSACNTSVGKVNQGEGIMSLARGFFKSGAKSVIPSLWSTNDKATSTITSDFYKNLSEGQTKSEALRTAKLSYLHNNSDAEASPHYWASLVLIGDSGTLLPRANNLLFFWIGLGALLMIILGYFLFKKIR